MERGITEEYFLETSNAINEQCERYVELSQNREKNKDELEQIENNILIASSCFIDDSNGFIQTDDYGMKEDFGALFGVVRGFKQYFQQISHLRGVIASALSKRDDDTLCQTATYLKMTNDLLKHNFEKAIELTNAIKEKHQTLGGK